MLRNYIFIGLLIFSCTFFFGATKVEALICNNEPNSDDCIEGEGFSQSYTGNYRVASVTAGMLLDETTESVNLNIPNCEAGPPSIIQAYLGWYMRDYELSNSFPPVPSNNPNPPDTTVNLSVNGDPATAESAERQYIADPVTLQPFSDSTNALYYYINMYTDITDRVSAGNHTYTISDFDYGDGSNERVNFGFSIQAIYECPEFETTTTSYVETADIYSHPQWTSDHGAWANATSELICTTFPAYGAVHTIDVFAVMPSQFPPTGGGEQRVFDVYVQRGSGSPPSSDINNPANLYANNLGGTINPNYHGTDSFSSAIPLNSTDEYLCIQYYSQDSGEEANFLGTSGVTSGLMITRTTTESEDQDTAEETSQTNELAETGTPISITLPVGFIVIGLSLTTYKVTFKNWSCK